MSQLDAILERSRAPGTFVERRRFSLARHKAIEKLREFALRNPRQYVLELIQAAVFSGATYIAVDVDADSMLVAWVGGRPFAERELASVFDHLFLDRGDVRHRHLIQLAVGLNAALQRSPRELRVESGDGSRERTVRLDLDRRGNGTLGTPEQPLAGTYVLARFGGGWFDRFGGEDHTPEERLVEERCRFSPVPILLNGRAPFGYRASRKLAMPGCPHFLPFDADDRFGVVAVPPVHGVSRGFALVVGGVWVTSVELPELGRLSGLSPGDEPRSLTGVIADDRLRKTADHGDIVRDARFTEMLHAVQPHATELIRAVSVDDYQAPELPRIVGGAQVHEPLPDPVVQLAPRPPMPVQALAAIPAGTPVFRVRPEDRDALVEAADPARLPFPVLVMPDTQVDAFEEAAPGLGVHRLAAPTDVDFVRRMLERRQQLVAGEAPFLDDRRPYLHGTLSLTQHHRGPSPLLHDPRAGDVPLLIGDGQRTLRCEPSRLGLPGVVVRLTLDAGVELLPDEPVPGLEQAALDLAWQLLPRADGPLDDASRALLIALLAAHASPQFVDREGRTGLEVALPRPPDVDVARLRGVPLTETAEGPLSFDGLLALIGSERVVELRDAADLLRLLPIEERLGCGHLTTAGLTGASVVAIGRGPGGWQALAPGEVTGRTVRQMVWLGYTFAPRIAGAGWQQVPLGLPCVGAAIREGDEDRGGWREGLRALFEVLIRTLHGDVPLAMAHVSSDHSRVRCMVRVAVLHLAARLEMLEEIDLLQSPDGRSWDSLPEARGRASFAVWPRHGPVVLDDDIRLLDLDELRVLERNGRLPLRFDDPPEVWDSLEDRDAPGWLVRTEVRVTGLRGWLGLRVPFDGTTGVFLQGEGERVALPDVDADVPCHGLVRSVGGHVELTTNQRQLLGLSRERLYQELRARVEEGLDDPVAADAARRYLAAARREPTERRDDAGVGAAVDLSRLATATDVIERRLLEASGEALEDGVVGVLVADAGADHPPVTLQQQWKLVALEINRDHPLGQEALVRDGRARELLLLEMARLVAVWAVGVGRSYDLLEAHRLLVAQRLG